MRILTGIGLLLYGIANLFAGTYDLSTARTLPFAVNGILLITGLVLIIAGVQVMRASRRAFAITVIALAAASALAVFNERVLGLGHPSHHIVRGAYTLLLLWGGWAARRRLEPDKRSLP